MRQGAVRASVVDDDMEYESCPWCGIETEKLDGPVHRYLESSPGCWAKYGELLAREYQDSAYMRVHGLTVDAYALQHPGKEGPQTISSVYVHLASLYSYFELGRPVSELPETKKEMTKYKKQFIWLEPPQDLKAITVEDILASNSAAEHCAKVGDWAEYIYQQWRPHHLKIATVLAVKTP